jgi:hypothetical protein
MNEVQPKGSVEVVAEILNATKKSVFTAKELAPRSSFTKEQRAERKRKNKQARASRKANRR